MSKKQYKIKTDMGVLDQPVWVLYRKMLWFWVKIYSSDSSYKVRELKNHLLLPDKTYNCEKEA